MGEIIGVNNYHYQAGSYQVGSSLREMLHGRSYFSVIFNVTNNTLRRYPPQGQYPP